MITFLGNKVHVYEVKSKNLAMCFFLGNITSTIRHISFDLKEKYLLILRNEAKEFGKLSLLKIENFKKECDCDKHNDNDVLEKVENLIKKQEVEYSNKAYNNTITSEEIKKMKEKCILEIENMENNIHGIEETLRC